MSEIKLSKSAAETMRIQAGMLCAEGNKLGGLRDSNLFQLGKLFSEMIHAKACETHFGVSFDQWVEDLPKDRNGRARKPRWARGLAHEYDVISEYPTLTRALEKPESDNGMSISTAFYAARLVKMRKVGPDAESRYTALYGPPSSPSEQLSREAYAREAVEGALKAQCAKPAHVLKQDCQMLRAELEKDPDGVPKDISDMGWKKVGGNVDAATHERWMEVVRWAYDYSDETRPANATFVRDLERVLALMEDVREALHARDAES